MFNQPSLFDAMPRPQPIVRTAVPSPIDDTHDLQAAFERFHRDNPHVYETLKVLALRAARKGQRVGMKAVYEMARWYYTVETDGEPYKLNNSFTAFYSRLLMEQEPELAGFFETRQQRAI